MSSLNLEIAEGIFNELTPLSKSIDRPLADLIQKALRRYLADEQFKRLGEITVPLAEAQGYLTGDDIFRAVS